MKKHIEVVAALIQKNKKVLATQRGYGQFQGGWEFPGGKIEPHETQEQALKREIQEELDVMIEVHDLCKTIEYAYPEFDLTMHCFWCTMPEDHFVLKEHMAYQWVDKNTLREMDWLPADLELLDEIEKVLA